MDEIGGRIRVARKGAGFSQEDLARRAEMSLNGMASIERGEIVDPHISTLSRIADALGMSVGELLEEPALAGKGEAPDEGPDGRRIEELAEAWHQGELSIQLLPDEERIKYIEKAVDILRHYYEMGLGTRAGMDGDLASHGSSYVWHGFYYNTLQPAMERDGVLMYASFVVDGPAEVSERERAACEKILNSDREMQYLLWDMRDVDTKNNARVREEGRRGVSEIGLWLEETTKKAASRRGPEEQ